jgi:O-antigen ligase
LNRISADRIQVNSALIVLCFASVLMLASQSAASYPSYLLAVAMLLTVRSWNDVFGVPFFHAVGVLLLVLCLSSLWSETVKWRPLVGISVRGLLVLFFVIAMAECQLRGQVQRWLGRALAIVGTAAAVAAITFYFLDPPADGRLAGLGQLDNQVVVGLVLGAVLILLVELILSDRSQAWRWVAALAAVAVAAAVWLSGSRNAVISLGLWLIVFLSAWRIRDKQRFAAAVAALGVLLAAVLVTLAMTDQGRELLLPRGDSFRLDIWSVVLSDLTVGETLFGRGILTPDQIVLDGKTFAHPHSMYLSVFFQAGLLGLVCFAVVIGWTVFELFGGYENRSAKLALGLLAMALSSYLLDGHELVDKVGETWFLFWLPVGIALGLAWSRRLAGFEPLSES